MVKSSSETTTVFNFARQYAIIEDTIGIFNLSTSLYEDHEKDVEKLSLKTAEPKEWNNLIFVYLREVLSDGCKGLQRDIGKKKFTTQKLSPIKKRLLDEKKKLNNPKNDLEKLYNIREELLSINEELTEIKFIDKINWLFVIIALILGFVLGILAEFIADWIRSLT